MAKEEVKANEVHKPAVRPSGLINLMAKFPKYNGGDARVAKVGTKGPPIHGLMLGVVDLPKTIKDEATGELKDWTGVVIELLQAAPADDPEGGEDDEPKWYGKGEKIVLTMSTVIDRPEIRTAANHRGAVFEVFIEPVVGKTKEGRSLWKFPVFDIGRPIKREMKHQVSNAALALARQFEEPEAPQLAAAPVGSTVNHPSVPQAHTA